MDSRELELKHRRAAKVHRCRCGTRISVGSPVLEFEAIPEPLTDLLRNEAFCTSVCVRAYLLEAMEVLEGAAAPELISDVHSVYSYLQSMFRVVESSPTVVGHATATSA